MKLWRIGLKKMKNDFIQRIVYTLLRKQCFKLIKLYVFAFLFVALIYPNITIVAPDF